MTTTAIKYSSSINIVRDKDYGFKYIPTPNSKSVFEQLLSNALSGQKAQIIIGAYGTGKSSLLLAFQQTLQGKHKHFKNKTLIAQAGEYEFIAIVGTYTSIISTFAEQFGIVGDYTSNDVIQAIDKKYKRLQKAEKGIAFIIDEFGKFLEYASKNNPEAELYFLQQLAEWVNNTKTQSLLLCTLHQDFNAYSNTLNKAQRQEWDKVKGRFNEIVFNEPVEQLLLLASGRLNSNTKTNSKPKLSSLFKCIKESKAFPLRDYFEIDTAQKLFPLDILSAAVLTLALQRYGQNERSLFSFLESGSQLSVKEWSKTKTSYYAIPQVYDYLLNTFYSTLSLNNKNSDYNQWSSIRKALERLEGIQLKEPLADAQELIKTIGLLNIFASAGAHLGNDFLTTYANLALGIKSAKSILDELVGFKIIRYVNHNFRYTIFEGTDLNIDLAIDDAGKLVERVTNVVNQLNQFFAFPFIPAKSYYYEVGTPRLFQFKLSEAPIVQVPEDEIDGFINLVFSDEVETLQEIIKTSQNCDEAILYGYYKNTSQIQNTLFEIQKVKKVISGNQEDKVALKILKDIEAHYTKLLNHQVMDSLYSEQGNISWYWRGEEKVIKSRQHFNQLLSQICYKVYRYTPVFKNELINKTKVSSQIAGARKLLTSLLLTNLNEENLGFPADRFPPEKTIYLSLLRENKIHVKRDDMWILQRPEPESFNELWAAGEQFLESTKGKQRNLQELIDVLTVRPFKLKRGFVDIWLPVFLLAKADDYALFDIEKGYVPTFNQDILDLLNKKPWMFTVKAFDVEGIRLELFNRYRVFLSQPENTKPNNLIFIQTIKPFLSFYSELNAYAKQTGKLNKHTIALREVIAKTKDPEKAFFEDFPTALGYTIQELQKNPALAETYILKLQAAIRELRMSFDELINRLEIYLTQTLLGVDSDFLEYKITLQKRYKNVKENLLPVQYKAFFVRLMSGLDDRNSWLNAIVQACVGKPMDKLTDDEEAVLHDKLGKYLRLLDNFSDISTITESDEEDVWKLEVTSAIKGLSKNLLRLPKSKKDGFIAKQAEVKKILGNDNQLSLAVLATLIQEYIQHD